MDDRKGVVVVDASGQVLGRLASKVAKLLLDGHIVYVINAPMALISGRRSSVVREWKDQLRVGSVVNPEHGPYHSRRPDRMIKDVVGGMLPRRKPKGREALKRLKVYNYSPGNLPDAMRFEDAEPRRPTLYYITLGEIAREMGWKP